MGLGKELFADTGARALPVDPAVPTMAWTALSAYSFLGAVAAHTGGAFFAADQARQLDGVASSPCPSMRRV